MSSKRHCRSSFRPRILAMIILCTSVWWAFAEVLAEEAAPAAMKMTAHFTLRPFERPEYNTAPFLEAGVVDREDEATSPSAKTTISRSVGQASFVNRIEEGDSRPLRIARLFDPSADARNLPNLQTEVSIERQTIEGSPDRARAIYSLLDGRSATGSFQYGEPNNLSASKQWSAAGRSASLEPKGAPRPLFTVEVGRWRLPVVISSPVTSR
jgi:hypothetical protein